jgi:hypothetical protein
MLVEIDEVAVERSLWLKAKGGDKAAQAEVRKMVNGLELSLHALSLDPAVEYEVVTLRDLDGLNLIDYIKCSAPERNPKQ